MCTDTYRDYMAKKTTTLTLDEELVKKAKNLNINISELAETVLKGFTFEPSDLEEKSLKEKYNELFAAILPILKNQKTRVHVGLYYWTNHGPESNVFLISDGTFYFDGVDDIVDLDISDDDLIMDSPKKILTNLIKAIDERKEKRKDELKEIEMVKRIVEALHPSFAKK